MICHSYNMAVKHWCLEDTLPPWVMTRDSCVVPPDDWPHWVRYSSPFESGKRTCRDFGLLPPWILMAVEHATSRGFTMDIRKITGLPDLIPAPFAHGGGLHMMEPGGHLDPHIDYAIHPDAPYLERRASLIVFACDFDPADGGQLQFWNDDATKTIIEHTPRFNKGIIFLNSDTSFHSVSKITGPHNRVSLAVYYCSPVRPGTTRKRALWAPLRA